jgi:hypothetical protein
MCTPRAAPKRATGLCSRLIAPNHCGNLIRAKAQSSPPASSLRVQPKTLYLFSVHSRCNTESPCRVRLGRSYPRKRDVCGPPSGDRAVGQRDRLGRVTLLPNHALRTDTFCDCLHRHRRNRHTRAAPSFQRGPLVQARRCDCKTDSSHSSSRDHRLRPMLFRFIQSLADAIRTGGTPPTLYISSSRGD